jgi:hypothetical protein
LPTAVLDPNKPMLKLSGWRTRYSGTTESGDTGRPGSRDGLQEEHLSKREKGKKTKKLLGKKCEST